MSGAAQQRDGKPGEAGPAYIGLRHAPADFAAFCRIWPMRSRREEVDAEDEFMNHVAGDRADIIAGCDALRGYMESVGFPLPPAAEVILNWAPRAWAEMARSIPAVRQLMRNAS